MNADKTYVTPAQGLNVIDPANGEPLPPEGKEVDRTIYWVRRANEGDVTEGYPATQSKKKTTKE